MGRRLFPILLCLLALCLSACSQPAREAVKRPEVPAVQSLPHPEPIPAPEPEPVPEPEPEPLLIVIDPGHQAQGDSSPEPIGPGAQEEKARVSSGTRGVVTGQAEYELNLQVSLLLKEELEQRGFAVVLTREENEVSLSNRERAELANSLGAAAFLRIHANGSQDEAVQGAMTICMSPDNPYQPQLYDRSRALSQAVLEELCAATGAVSQALWETDTMSGINYSTVPVTIVEMGYLTNPAEDRRLADPAYQRLVAQGIAQGVEQYFGGQVEE